MNAINTNTNKGNQFSFKIHCFPLQFVSFIEKRKIGKLRRRDASKERRSRGGYAPVVWTVIGLFLLPIMQDYES